jgi:hypothetical protein
VGLQVKTHNHAGPGLADLHRPEPWLRLHLRRVLGLLCCGLLLSGCTTTSLLLSAVGVATDTSIPWAVAKHVHAKLTEGDPVACYKLNTVQRALSERCGPFVPGSLVVADIHYSGLETCPLSAATQDPQFWPVLAELHEKGALSRTCSQSPLLPLARSQPCPEFAQASPAVLQALAWLARSDARAVQPEVMRLLSCSNSRAAGLTQLLDEWLAQGKLEPTRLGFNPFNALHPDHLESAFSRDLEQLGHKPQAAWVGGRLPSSFELALRLNHWQGLEWWLARSPQLAQSVPPAQANQLPWLPLARVLAPNFLAQPENQASVVKFLLARGASPLQTLPANPYQTVLGHAKEIRSPMVPLLSAPAVAPTVAADQRR